jgi:heme exporter protein D
VELVVAVVEMVAVMITFMAVMVVVIMVLHRRLLNTQHALRKRTQRLVKVNKLTGRW